MTLALLSAPMAVLVSLAVGCGIGWSQEDGLPPGLPWLCASVYQHKPPFGGLKQARAGAGAQPKPRGAGGPNKRPEGPRRPPGAGARAPTSEARRGPPEARRAEGPGGTRGATRWGLGSAERSKGDPKGGARSRAKHDPGTSRGQREPAEPRSGAQGPSEGAGGPGPKGAHSGRARRAGADERTGPKGPGAAGREVRKKGGGSRRRRQRGTSGPPTRRANRDILAA